MGEEKPFKWKVCLIGESAVGKTSLIKRFVYNLFDDSYSNTIGTNVTKKELKITDPKDQRERDAYLMIWDLMGHQCFLHMLRQSYFFGAQGLIAVCDLTRKKTFDELTGWLEQGITVTGEVPIVILGNKFDLEDEIQVEFTELEDFAASYPRSVALQSSVKTGYNVEHVFQTLCGKMLDFTNEGKGE